MRTISILAKRELRAYFYSPIAYAIIFMFLFIAGYFFFAAMDRYTYASFEMSRMAQVAGPQQLTIAQFVVTPLFGNMSVVMLLMTPLVAMRLFSEEKKAGSIELLFTWPATDFQIALGKYLAGLAVMVVMLAATAPFIGFLWLHTAPPWGSLLCGYLGLGLQAAAFLALGLFVSTLTENQIISATISFGALLIFWIGGWTVAGKTDMFSQIVAYLSIMEHFNNLARGILDSRDVIYFLSFTIFFLFLTLRSLEAEKIGG